VVGGFILFALLAGLAATGIGPFAASVSGSATAQGGAVEVVVRVTNTGTRPAGASCRVSRGGVSGVGDAVFFTPPIPAGETREFTQLLPPPRAGVTATSALVVRCN
jgi:hypothetical protein